MANELAIENTSQALRRILIDELSVREFTEDHVAIESIDAIPDPPRVPRITIFLFNIRENSFLKNREMSLVPGPGGAADLQPPPIVLDLDYMICVWLAAGHTADEHEVLGDIVRVFYDHSELSPALLGPSWKREESVQVTLNNPSIEDQTRIWTSFGFKRFKLALYYRASIVPIASKRTFAESLVRQRDFRDSVQDPREGASPRKVG
ncbi:DUF4255 domain-containing protein [Pendulispora brunnea]|uniref:DUF4255 domain-containing protein n=1 Tax=Pendulispora brunnea TaxID=2905690 RepID=A0ABZ2KPR0_9BACT